MTQKLLSIVVPTKNRYKYLYKLVELISSFCTNEIELVIQDNSDDNSEFENYLSNKKLDFVKYFHTSGQIPMSKNSDLAILNSTGEYICFIGDDDGVTKEIIECVKMMKAKDIEAIKPSVPSYCWPDVRPGKYLNRATRIIYELPDNKLEKIDNNKVLEEIVSKGFINRGRLPLLYHGIVKRSTLDKIYNIGGTFFPGSSPDIANAVALTLISEKCYTYNRIITISGASMYHGGGAYITTKKHPQLEDIKWLLPKAIDNWNPKVPKIGEGAPIWCDSATKALEYFDRTDLLQKVNYENLYLSLALSYRDLLEVSLSYTRNKPKFYIKFIYNYILKKTNGLYTVFYNKRGMVPGKHTKVGFKTIIEASVYFSTLNNVK